MSADAPKPAGNSEVLSESADLLFHLLWLLKSRGLSLPDVFGELKARYAAREASAAL